MIKDYSHDEIINALKTVRNVCKQFDNCNQCPLYNMAETTCVVQSKPPCDWIFIEESTVWRAIK